MTDEKKVSFSDSDSHENKEITQEEVSTEVAVEEKKDYRGTPLFKYFAKALGIDYGLDEKVLDEVSFEGIAKYIKEGKCKNIITMAGAGISTSAGIPDFRSPKTGIYHNLEKYNLPNPEAIFTIDYFKKDPVPFYENRKFMFQCQFKPTVCHYFIKMLNDEGILLRHYTQNIDALERKAGLEDGKIVEAHGTLHTSHCMKCHQEYTLEWMNEVIFRDEIPRCTEEGCDGVVRPNIVMFGEQLPQRFNEMTGKDFEKCDLLIILGTSLLVQPFASLVSRVPITAPRLYINLERGATAEKVHPVNALLFGGGFKFDDEDNDRDVFWQGTCDDGCQALADLIGWGDELKDAVANEHHRLEQQMKETSRRVKSEDATKEQIPKKKSNSTALDMKKVSDEKTTSEKKNPLPREAAKQKLPGNISNKNRKTKN